MQGLTIISIILIAANVLFSMQGFKDYSFIEKYKFRVGSIQNGEHIRMLSSGFLHADWQHLIFNMLTLYFFSNIVIFSVGVVGYILIYFISLILGNLFTLYFYRNEPYYSAVGASGAVTGILYAAILFFPKMTIIFFVIPMPAYLFGIGYLLYSIYGMRTRRDNIGHSAHFGGAVGGYLYAIVSQPSIIYTETLMVILLTIPIILLFVLYKMKKI